jgi:putative Ca2+/H+ antiporter (TMEM165/GDT1 family)
MEAFAVSFGLVALAEIGDKTQLLALVLATRFRRPWPILAGIFVATLLNHLLASAVGLFVGIAFSGAVAQMGDRRIVLCHRDLGILSRPRR